MATWRDHMPAGMFLKSDGFASNLSDPDKTYTLQRYCEQAGEPYDHTGHCVGLQTFCAYGLDFQKQCVPDLEQKWVTQIDLSPGGFQLKLDNGEEFQARNVVLAVGVTVKLTEPVAPVALVVTTVHRGFLPDLASSVTVSDATPLRCEVRTPLIWSA